MADSKNRLSAFIAELRRRKVLRSGGIYLLVAWGAVQVADTVFPNIGLPQWSVRLVIALAGIGLPAVLVLSWFFDVSRAGTPHRTDASPDSTADQAGAASGRPRRAVWVTGVVALLAVLAIGAWVLWPGRRDAAALDESQVVVLPFRTAGAGPDVQYLREGLMDLFAASLNGRDGLPSAIPPRAVARILQDRLGSIEEDPSQDVAFEVARRLGAGRVLEGEVVGSAAEVTVHAVLYDAATGRKLTDAVLPPRPADSLHAIVDGLTGQVAGAAAGLSTDRLAALTTRSLPALRAYLDGQRAFRRGDHVEAVRAFDNAVGLDSTFALAALGLTRSLAWTFPVPETRNGDRAFRLAWARRGELPTSDRTFLEATSPDYPGVAPYPRIVRVREQAVERAPDDPQLRYLLGDSYLHYGPAAGVEDPDRKAFMQFQRAVALDSTYIEPLMHLHDLAIEFGDTAVARRAGDHILAVDAKGPRAEAVRWARARVPGIGDPGEPVVADSLDPSLIMLMLVTGLGSVYSPDLADAAYAKVRSAETGAERDRAAELALSTAYKEGRPSKVREMLYGPLKNSDWDYDRLVASLFWAPDSARAEAAAAEVRSNLGDPDHLVTDGGVDWRTAMRACILGHWRAERGDEGGALRIAAQLAMAASATGDPESDAIAQSTSRTCSQVLRAVVAVKAGAPDARDAVVRADTLLAGSARPNIAYRELAAIVMADLWQRLGDDARALAAARRLARLPTGMDHFPDLELIQAQLADRTGDTEEAIRLYANYVRWRVRAEPPFTERAARARQRLAQLRGDRG